MRQRRTTQMNRKALKAEQAKHEGGATRRRRQTSRDQHTVQRRERAKKTTDNTASNRTERVSEKCARDKARTRQYCGHQS